MLDEFDSMRGRYSTRASFAVVYIAEAHARDTWPVGPTVSVCDQPKTMAERVEVLRELGRSRAGRCLRGWPAGSVLVDGLRDNFLEAFGAWPLRMLVFRAQGPEADAAIRLVFKGQPDDHAAYHLEDLEDWLSSNC